MKGKPLTNVVDYPKDSHFAILLFTGDYNNAQRISYFTYKDKTEWEEDVVELVKNNHKFRAIAVDTASVEVDVKISFEE